MNTRVMQIYRCTMGWRSPWQALVPCITCGLSVLPPRPCHQLYCVLRIEQQAHHSHGYGPRKNDRAERMAEAPEPFPVIEPELPLAELQGTDCQKIIILSNQFAEALLVLLNRQECLSILQQV